VESDGGDSVNRILSSSALSIDTRLPAQLT
jgi:hypothetical protein